MLDISVIILTYNEEIHIRRCLDNVLPFAKDIFILFTSHYLLKSLTATKNS